MSDRELAVGDRSASASASIRATRLAIASPISPLRTISGPKSAGEIGQHRQDRIEDDRAADAENTRSSVEAKRPDRRRSVSPGEDQRFARAGGGSRQAICCFCSFFVVAATASLVADEGREGGGHGMWMVGVKCGWHAGSSPAVSGTARVIQSRREGKRSVGGGVMRGID